MQVHLFDSSAGRLVCFVTCPHQAIISELISDVQVNRVALIRKCIDKLSQTVFACLCKVGAADEWISQNKMQGQGSFSMTACQHQSERSMVPSRNPFRWAVLRCLEAKKMSCNLSNLIPTHTCHDLPYMSAGRLWMMSIG